MQQGAANTEIPNAGPCTNFPARYQEIDERLAWFYGCMHEDPPSAEQIRAIIASLPADKRTVLEPYDFPTKEALLGTAASTLPIQIFPDSVASPATAEQPPVAKCRADAKALFAELQRPGAMDASYFVWSSRAEEMSHCQDLDPVVDGDQESVPRGILYMGLENTARTQMIGALDNFIHRHGLQKQFADDDDAGLR
jgi:hypothetical protein